MICEYCQGSFKEHMLCLKRLESVNQVPGSLTRKLWDTGLVHAGSAEMNYKHVVRARGSESDLFRGTASSCWKWLSEYKIKLQEHELVVTDTINDVVVQRRRGVSNYGGPAFHLAKYKWPWPRYYVEARDARGYHVRDNQP